MNKIKQEYILASVAILILGTFFVSSYFGFGGSEKYIKNNSASVWSSVLDFFGFDQSCNPQPLPEGSVVSVDDENNTIDVTITNGNLNSMCFVPNIQTVYSKAVVTPDPSEPQDFTNPVTYTINQDGFIKEYVMSVKIETPTSTPNISTCQELQNINSNLSGDYTLANNIDCSDTQNWNGGGGFKPIGNETKSFSGSFDGKGYAISNLHIFPMNNNVGLFGYVTGNISNVGLLNVDVVSDNYEYVGGLVGQLSAEGTITSSFSTGKVVGRSYAGGLVGLSSGTISKSYSSVKVGGNSNGGGLVGGLGPNYVGTISNSYATGDVEGSYGSAGLVGMVWSGTTISNCYSTGKAIIGQVSGGLIGYTLEGVNLENSYWDIQTSGQTTSAGGEGKTTSEMKNPATFSNWDANIWSLVAGSYPIFKTGSVPVVYPLEWSPVFGQLYWANADTFCKNPANGYERLPTLNELTTALTEQFINSNPAIVGFEGDIGYWAGTNDGYGGADLAGYSSGSVNNYRTNGTQDRYFRCVRESKTSVIVSTGGGTTGGGNTGSGGGTTVINDSSFAGGTGTVADPYQIANWTQLNNIRNKLSSNFILTSNLSSASNGYVGLGDSWIPIGNSSNIFTGSFNGNSNTITNLTVGSSVANYAGLFGYSTGNISNLGLINININSNHDYVGALVGLMGGGKINQSYSTGSISGSNYVGGLVGQQAGGQIFDSYSNVNITDFTSNAGGLVGQQKSSGVVTNSYSTGKVVSSQRGTSYGGMIGNQYPSDSERVHNSYWDKTTSGQSTSAAGIGKTTTEMKIPATFTGWDPNIWNITNGSYPSLVAYSNQTRVSFTTSSNTVPKGGSVTLSWNIANASSCTASGGDSSWAGTTLGHFDGSHTWTSGALSSGTYTYNISCSGSRGTANTNTIVSVSSDSINSVADLNCSLSMISPITPNNEVNVNNNTVWKATPNTACPTCTVNWSVTDISNPNPTMIPGTNPWNKIFTTVGLKTVSAQFVSSNYSGTPCTANTTIVQTGGGTEL